MTEISWNDNLSVSIDLIDKQYKMLIQKIQGLSEAVAANRIQPNFGAHIQHIKLVTHHE
ncbi:MAG: hypothetical protein ACFFBJ_12855 [Promethearchaeota archaeon]